MEPVFSLTVIASVVVVAGTFLVAFRELRKEPVSRLSRRLTVLEERFETELERVRADSRRRFVAMMTNKADPETAEELFGRGPLRRSTDEWADGGWQDEETEPVGGTRPTVGKRR